MITKVCLDTDILINAIEKQNIIDKTLFGKLTQSENIKLFYSEQTLRELEAGLNSNYLDEAKKNIIESGLNMLI